MSTFYRLQISSVYIISSELWDKHSIVYIIYSIYILESIL